MNETIKKIEKSVIELLGLLDELKPAEENVYIGGTLRAVLNSAKQKIEAQNKPPKTAEERKAERVRNAEANLEKREKSLADYRKMAKQARYSLKGGRVGRDVSAEDLDRLEQRVEWAKIHLARAKGDDVGYFERKKAEILEKKRLERMKEAEGVAAWQERARKQKQAETGK